MATLLALVALAAFIGAILYVVRKDWRLAGVCGVICVLALILNAHARNAQAQQAAQQGNFPIPLNSGGTIPK
jgi:hypothetical protein